MGNPIVTNTGKVLIPEGYRWCNSCSLFLPHTKRGKWGGYDCELCGDYSGDLGCPNCGANEPVEDTPFTIDITLHHLGCHCRQGEVDELVRDQEEQWWHLWRNYADWIGTVFYAKNRALRPKERKQREVLCGCPIIIAYTNPWIYDYESHSVYSMDCMNAIEWSFMVRCQICGEPYEVQDGNC